MMSRIVHSLPLGCYKPMRFAAARMARGNLLRKACVLVLQTAHRTHRNVLMHRLSVVRPLDAPELSFAPANSMVLEALYWYGVRGYEGIVPRVWTALAAKAQSTLEIGGNIGLYASIGGRVAPGRYTVVEPVPEVAAQLRRNLALNGVRSVDLLEAAAIPADSERPVRLSIPREANDLPVGSHLMDGVEVSGRTSSRTLDVRGLPFRALAEGRDLIKIDAEGIEAELLLSATDILRQNQPSVMIEVLPTATRLASVIGALARDAGYGIWALPEYGHDNPICLDAADFHAGLPGRYNAKDVLLSLRPPP